LIPGIKTLLNSIPEKATTSSREPNALLITRQLGNQKTLTFTGQGFYRWDLIFQETPNAVRFMDHWIGQSVRWLATPEAGKTVRLSVPKAVYHSGESIPITAEVYDETYRPVENAVLTLTMKTPSFKPPIQTRHMGNGRYQTVFQVNESGTHQLFCEAFSKNHLLGKDTIEFAVTSFNPEFLDASANPELLQSLAKITGGKSGPPDSLASVVHAMQFPRRERVLTREIALYHLPTILVLVVVLLSLEWLIRKRKGMT
jgi:hypothetical protein